MPTKNDVFFGRHPKQIFDPSYFVRSLSILISNSYRYIYLFAIFFFETSCTYFLSVKKHLWCFKYNSTFLFIFCRFVPWPTFKEKMQQQQTSTMFSMTGRRKSIFIKLALGINVCVLLYLGVQFWDNSHSNAPDLPNLSFLASDGKKRYA